MAVDNYLFQYKDGTTGNTPYQTRADGTRDMDVNATLIGRSMPDGSVAGGTMGNVTSNGMVDTYGGYQTPAANFYGNGNDAAWGTTSPALSAPPAGYGMAPDSGGASFGGGSTGGASGGTYGAYQMPSQGQPQGGASFGGGSQNLGMGGGSSQGFTGGNPYLSQMGDALTQQATQAFNRNVLPAIGSQSMATGGYGGSRQGVIEANAMNDLGQNMTNSLAGMYGNAYNTGLQYDLGLRNNNLGFANLDRNINNDNNSWALQGANFGLGVNNQLNANAQTGINSGTTIQNTPQTYWNNFSQGANSIGQGYGTSTGSTNMPGSPITGALGGAQLGSQLSNWWGSGNGGASNNNFWSPGFNGSMGD